MNCSENMRKIICDATVDGDVIISSVGDIVKDCKINGNVIVSGACNALIAKCEISGEIKIDSSLNCAIILNRAASVTAENSTNIYVVENILSGILSLSNNDYLLADQNECAEVVQVKNMNFNGDNLMDVDARLEFGADEDLLPHPNKDLFIGMPRYETVPMPDALDNEHINEYIARKADGGNAVIVPPGAYVSPEPIKLGSEASGTTIYAYGVLQEMVPYGNTILPTGVDNLTVKGLTMSYVDQACGQITIVEEIDERTFTALPYAGSDGGFGKTDPHRFALWFTDVFAKGHNYPWAHISDGYELWPNGDGTYKFQLHENSHIIGHLHKGDRMTCRLGGGDRIAMMPISCKNFVIKDVSLYGHSALLAIAAYETSRDMLCYRWYNGTYPATLIDKETYDRYREFEKKYGIEGEVYIDSQGRYRGGTPLICSSDSAHIDCCSGGLSATSCLFESMCDDGSNQHGFSARLASLKDNGDGTTTVTYKGSVSEGYCLYFFNESAPVHYPHYCKPFKEGHRVLIYTSSGKTVCDTTCLADQENNPETYEFTLYPPNRNPRHYTDRYRTIIVPTKDVNFAAIEGYDLDDVSYDLKNKVFVDNLGRNSVGFTFDNVVVRNTRSFGMRIQTLDVNIKNCTFSNLGHAGLSITAVDICGESSVSQNVTIKNCLFDNLGFTNGGFHNKANSPIAVHGFSTVPDENSLLYKNILIEGNKFINNRMDYAIALNSATNVKILNNVFCEAVGEDEEHPHNIIDIDTVADIEISGNKCSKYLESVAAGITAKNYKNVYGSDVALKDNIG